MKTTDEGRGAGEASNGGPGYAAVGTCVDQGGADVVNEGGEGGGECMCTAVADEGRERWVHVCRSSSRAGAGGYMCVAVVDEGRGIMWGGNSGG